LGAEDYSQAHDLAALNPEKLQELVALFDSEARRNNVYPLVPWRAKQPPPVDGKTTFSYRDGVTRVPVQVAPNLSGRSHTITADIEVPDIGARRSTGPQRQTRQVRRGKAHHQRVAAGEVRTAILRGSLTRPSN
jgi:hypothetical protein